MGMEYSTKATCQQYFTKAHDMVRRSVKEFVDKEVKPFIDEWEEAGSFPREIYKKAGDVGILGIGYPDECGGTPGDVFFTIAASEELMRSGSGGFVAGLGSLNIALPPILRRGTDEQKEKFVNPVVAGERIAALAITESGGGSDVSNLATTAVRDGDHYIVSGSKNLHYQRHPGRSDHLCRAHRGPRGPRHQHTGDRSRHPGVFGLLTAQKNRLVGIGHRRNFLR